jgi:hypothetical protein
MDIGRAPELSGTPKKLRFWAGNKEKWQNLKIQKNPYLAYVNCHAYLKPLYVVSRLSLPVHTN